MPLATLLKLPFRYQPWRPRHARLILRDFLATRRHTRAHRIHLEAAIDWLCRAQDARRGQPDEGGVSAGWSFEDGWLPSYPETSGYIVETLLAAGATLDRPELRGRAERIVDWLLSIQHADGAFPGHFGEPGSRPVIFNTGQIMHGMLAGFLQLGRNECLAAAVRAGNWLVRQQDPDGCWRRFEHNDIPHTYNTRATWALLATGLVAGEKKLVDASRPPTRLGARAADGERLVREQRLHAGAAPFTHTIAYAIRGFLECGVLLDEERYLRAAQKAARAVAAVQRDDGWLAGTLDRDWRPSAGYCCLTGVAQMALNWIRLAQETGVDAAARARAPRPRVPEARAGHSTTPTRSYAARSPAPRRSGARTRGSSSRTGRRSSSPTR